MHAMFGPDRHQGKLERYRGWALYSFCCLLALGVVLPYAVTGNWPQSHETVRYPLLIEHFYQAFLAGKWWPRWLPNLDGGYGYAEFVFYQPLFFFLALPFRLLFGGPVAAAWGAIWVTLAIGACGSLRLCRGGRDPLIGLCGAVLFLLAPYVYVNWLVRGDLSELLAMAVCPWVLAFYLETLSVQTNTTRRQLPVAMALCLAAHPLVGIAMGAVLALASLPLLRRGSGRKVLVRLLAAGALAVGLSSPYWLPVVSMGATTHLSEAFTWEPGPHTVEIWQFVSDDWNHGLSLPLPHRDGMSFSLGRVFLGLALAGCLVGWRVPQTRRLLVVLLGTMLLMTPWLAPAWSLPVLSTFQFPWRLLSVCVALQLGLFRGLGEASQPCRSKVASLCLLIVLVAGWIPEQFSLPKVLPDAEARVMQAYARSLDTLSTLDVLAEKRPRTASQPPSKPLGSHGLRVIASGGAKVVEASSSDPHSLQYAILTQRPTVVTIRQFFLPGWSVKLNGVPVAEETLRRSLHPDGLIRVQVSPRADGKPVQLLASYGHPRGAVLGYFLMGLTILCMFGFKRLKEAWARFATWTRAGSSGLRTA